MTQTWINPVLLSLGPVQIRWYGTLFVISFLIGVLILKYLAKKKFWVAPESSLDPFISWLIVGMFLGARLAYVFLYNWEFYSSNLGEIFLIWKGGLSFHGALVGMCIAAWMFAKKYQLHFFQVTDALAIAATPGLLLGRIGNFINGELYGTITDSWLGVIFPGGGPFPRHPSQLYEGFAEGALLFAILFYALKREKIYGVVSSFFFLGYGALRFVVEFFREPDPQVGYLYHFFTMGQLLCVVMIVIGFIILSVAKKKNLQNPLLFQR